MTEPQNPQDTPSGTISVSSYWKIVRVINDLDYTNIRERAQKRYVDYSGRELEKESLDNAVSDYKLYLMLRVFYPGKVIVPTKLIDLMWESHILDTKRYPQDCAKLLNAAGLDGTYIHHDPHILPGTPEHKAGVMLLEELFRTHFQADPHSFVRGESAYADCGTCA